MVIESTKIARRRRWVSWLPGFVSGRGTVPLILLYVSMLFPELLSLVGVTLTISAAPGYTFVPFLVFTLALAVWLVSSLVRHLARATYSLPLFWSSARVTAAEGAVEVTRGVRSSRVSRGEVLAGWTMSHDGPMAALQTKGQTIFIRTPDDETAETLLEQAGAGMRQRALSMPLERSPRWSKWDVLVGRLRSSGRLTYRLWRLVVFCAAACAAHVLFELHWLASAVVVLFAIATLNRLRVMVSLLTTRVRVGTDGFTIRRFGKRQFVSGAQIASMWHADGAVHIDLRDGQMFAFRAPSPVASVILIRRIQAMMESSGADEPIPEDIGALRRDGRAAREWLRAVRRAAELAGSYRSGWMDGRDLAALVVDGRANAEQRIAAAAALSVCSDQEASSHLRIRLDACADETVSLAIERALDGELEAAEIERVVAGASPVRARSDLPTPPTGSQRGTGASPHELGDDR